MNILFDKNSLDEILHSFYTLTQIRIAVFDAMFHEIASYPNVLSNYCSIIREDPTALKQCLASDEVAFKYCQTSKKQYSYRCHAGLTESIVPIFADQMIIGYLMIGQIIQTSNQDKLWKELISYLSTYEINLTLLEKSYYSYIPITEEKLNAAARIMEVAASYLYTSRKMTLKKETLAYQIEAYITSHIQEDLAVPVICRYFNISKSQIYTISEKYYGMGISSHIKNIRIQKAKEYLIDFDYPISEIATLVGIPDYNYFTKVFKQVTGMTPRDYRKHYKA